METLELKRPHLRGANILREALETVAVVLAVFTLVNLATMRFFIDGPSMEPTFFTGQYIIVDRTSYLLGAPQRGDIVVFDPPDISTDLLVKRLIGLPGDTVEIIDQRVYVNDVLLDEPYVVNGCDRCVNETWTLGQAEYFLMGDNRDHSRDSRAFGPVPRDHIYGEAVFRYFPLDVLGVIADFRFPR